MNSYFRDLLHMSYKQNKLQSLFCPIIMILRQEKSGDYNYGLQEKYVVIQTSVGEELLCIPSPLFLNEAENLLKAINENDGAFGVPQIEKFVNNVTCNSLNSKSSNKTDIRIILHDRRAKINAELGYSIKSKLGADSTLINSNKDGTNFVYKIHGVSAEQVVSFNALDRFKKKFDYLKSIGATISYYQTANRILHHNLTLLDLGIERIIADSLLDYYGGNGRTLAEITEHISKADPLNIARDTDQPMYAYKVKQLLLAFALGMTSSSPWYGNFHANGGYIVVKEDGDIICYHFFDRNDLEEYLFYNTRFETPSTLRHHFGEIYQENGEYFLKLNLQVRFK